MNYVLPLILFIISSVLFLISKTEDMKIDEVFKDIEELFYPKTVIEQVFETETKCLETATPYFDAMKKNSTFLDIVNETPYKQEDGMTMDEYIVYRNNIMSNRYKQQDGFITMDNNLNMMVRQDYDNQKRKEDKAFSKKQREIIACEDNNCTELITSGKSDMALDRYKCAEYAAWQEKNMWLKENGEARKDFEEEVKKGKEDGWLTPEIEKKLEKELKVSIANVSNPILLEKIKEITLKYTNFRDFGGYYERYPVGCIQGKHQKKQGPMGDKPAPFSKNYYYYNHIGPNGETGSDCNPENKCVNLKKVDINSIRSVSRAQPISDNTTYNRIIYNYIDDKKSPNPNDKEYGIAKKIQYDLNAYSQYGFIPLSESPNSDWNKIIWTIQQEKDNPKSQDELNDALKTHNAEGLVKKYCKIRSKDSPDYIENKSIMEKSYLQCLDNKRLWLKFMKGQYENAKFSNNNCKNFKNRFPKNALDKEYKMFQDCVNQVDKYKKDFHKYDPAELYNDIPKNESNTNGACIINSEFMKDSPDGLVTNIDREKKEQKNKKRLNKKCLTEQRYGSAIFSILSNKKYKNILKKLEEQLEEQGTEEQKKKLEDEKKKHDDDVSEIELKISQCKQEEQEKINKENEEEKQST